ncbi:hypothetical protein DS745_21305 [Anaerobacillus alkaliphilus]|uniref:Spore coat protein n=1 Tax=Anaerobacillus alkaliphilus TaxID=1548597 RepID=A0A4Q0VML1_9BACI|nr:hypothetical protein [Anaerobacillus alkaliphilus]RXI96274.1 hypothetical protein DS745_21305 [Anaerobacillus alkaliphilus]
MQPLTTKELEYIVDSMSNEDLLIKQCVAIIGSTQNQNVKQVCQTMVNQHQQHYQQLMNVMQQHQSMGTSQTQ